MALQSIILDDLKFKVLEFNSDLQIESINLRREVLRKPIGLDFNETELEEEFDQIHIAAILNDNIVGILLLKLIDKEDFSVIKMRQVAVDPQFQSLGIGKLLVRFAEKIAIEKGHSLIDLHARKTVISFYENMGYQKLGEEFIEVGIPHYRMIKRISDLD